MERLCGDALNANEQRMSDNAQMTIATQIERARTLYDVLGLPADASTTTHDVKTAFRRRSLLVHPDKLASHDAGHSDEAVECVCAFQRLVHARDVLTNQTTREEYNRQLANDRLHALASALDIMSMLQSRDAPHARSCDEALNRSDKETSDTSSFVGHYASHHTEQHVLRSTHAESGGQFDALWSTSNEYHTIPPVNDAQSSLSLKRGLCSSFGCLRTLPSNEEKTRGTCERCAHKPSKCSVFGCLTMTTNGRCTKHRTTDLLDGDTF